ncbi:MAG: hypothetical protein FJ265_02735 [Planctomycetes bacterium]|nr:hypothetical protein [Planctomycetota bacterium]
MRPLAALSGFAFTATLLLAQAADPAAPARPPRAAEPFPALEARLGGHWLAQWNPATGTPCTIYGTGLRLLDWRENSLPEARRHARRLLAEQTDLLQLGDSEFRESIGARMGRSWSFVFDQYFHGLPCIGGRADVRVNGTGVVAMFGSTAWPVPADFDCVPRIDEGTAEATAWLQVAGTPAAARERRPNRLVIWGDVAANKRAQFFLAWEIPVSAVDAGGDGPIGRVYVDARSGAVLHYANDKHECGLPGCTGGHGRDSRPAQLAAPVPTTVTVMAWTRTGLSATAAPTNVPAPGLDVQVAGLGTYTTDQHGRFTIDISSPVTVSAGPLDGVHTSAILDPTNQGPTASVVVSPGVPAVLQIFGSGLSPEQAAHTNTYHWVHRGNEWARSVLGNSPELALADQCVPSVNTSGSCNAWYFNNTINFYPTAGGCNNTAFSTVVLHEWGHGLDDRYGGISNNNGDGLSEGWADIIAMYPVDDPVVGLDFWNGGYIRHGMNNTMYGTQWQVHAAGQVWMGFAWRLRENLRASVGTASAIAISDDIVLGSIVADANDQQQAVVEVFVADDDDGILANGVPHYAELSAAAIAKGLPYPQIQVAWVNHARLLDTTVALTPRLVTAQTGLVAGGSITQVRLVYRHNGGAPQTRVMVPTGNPGEYRALLPGIGSGQVVYHIEATHSSGSVVRTPGTGEHRYVVAPVPVGPFTGFYAENFDGGAPGWTHGAIAGADEWNVGAPAGASGSSFGIAWSDPSSAWSGPNVAGTDLGGSFGNGSYEANAYQYLRAPLFDCSNLRGLHVRFRRWLTCEEGQYDKAMLLVNGDVVWQNPEFGAFVDTSWQWVEYAIPMADGNPAVQIEFALSSDAGLELGGWNVDDFELGTRATAPLPATLRWLPEQAGGSTPTSITVTTPAQQIFAVGISDSPGPTTIGNLPPLSIGSNMLTFSAFTDGSGFYQVAIPPFPGAPATGMLWYCQVVTIDQAGTFQLSNQHLVLFTQ